MLSRVRRVTSKSGPPTAIARLLRHAPAATVTVIMVRIVVVDWNMSSWAADVNAYVNQKSHTAPAMEPMVRYARRDGAGRRRENREYDIVSCAFKNEATVQKDRARKQDETRAHITKAVERDLSKVHHCYDIVTMAPKYGVDEATVSTVGGNQEPRGKRIQQPEPFINYDIVNHERVKGREHIRDDNRPKKSGAPKPRPERQTNILNHQYLKDHEERAARDDATLRAKIDRAVDNDRAFNPITQQFNDAAQEQATRAEKIAYEEERRELVRTHTYNTSGIVKRSEGHAFDIVTNHVYNPDMVLRLDQRDATSIPQRAALRQKWEHERDVEEAMRDADVDRALKRVAKQRLQDSVSHGHDIITNEPFVRVDVEDTKTKPHLLTLSKELRVPSTMEQLTASMEVKPVKHTHVLRTEGPRTTTERLFNVPDDKSAATNTFTGRQQLLLPSLDKVKARAPDTGSAFL